MKGSFSTFLFGICVGAVSYALVQKIRSEMDPEVMAHDVSERALENLTELESRLEEIEDDGA
ncbi:MAG: hypothetical protein KF784_10690 [Fimbriimonadaceae bacterium]|nr:hypothetical protein [Fimbriimonadaceae bacterium]